MTCWKCGRTMELLTSQKVNSRDECECGADLRVCRNCQHYDPAAHHECRETMAEWVGTKDRANYCDYFSPVTVVHASGPRAPGKASAPAPNDARARFDQLFKK